MSLVRTRSEIASLLARSDRHSLVTTVDDILREHPTINVDVIRSPETGTVQLQVREPVCEERFILADALVTVAEVSVDETIGWAMRVGTDAEATLAAAIADALLAGGGSPTDSLISSLTSLVESAHSRLEESERLAARDVMGTVINFEELD